MIRSTDIIPGGCGRLAGEGISPRRRRWAARWGRRWRRGPGRTEPGDGAGWLAPDRTGRWQRATRGGNRPVAGLVGTAGMAAPRRRGVRDVAERSNDGAWRESATSAGMPTSRPRWMPPMAARSSFPTNSSMPFPACNSCAVNRTTDGARSAWRGRRGRNEPGETSRAWERPPWVASALDQASGQRVEVHAAYHRWLAAWLPNWQAGRLLTIDYGDRGTEIYRRQPRGTLRAYFQHQRFVGAEVYQRFGHQDLTADVNFTDLQAWGEAAGLVTARYETQADFLRRWLPRRARGPRARRNRVGLPARPGRGGWCVQSLEQVRFPRQNDA